MLQSGQLSDAVRVCGQLIDADPADPVPYLCLAKLAHHAGSYQKSSELAAEAILRKPDWSEAYLQLAAAMRELADFPMAMRALEMAVHLSPDHGDARLALADLYYEQGLLDLARRAYQEALQCSPACSRSAAMLRLLGVDPAHITSLSRRSEPAGGGLGFSSAAWQCVHISILAPDGYSHWQAFAEMAQSLRDSLRKLGIASDIALNEVKATGVNILLGAHLIRQHDLARSLGSNCVIFNLEQIDGVGIDRLPVYKELLASRVVWDYSARNLSRIRQLTGNESVHHLGIGYVDSLSRIAPAATMPTDVLFYGSLNARRAAVLDQLRDSGLRVRHLFNVYGADRDLAIASAKVVLNMHFYDDSIHEIVRTSYLLANRKAVVSECNPDTEIDDDIREALRAVPYAELHDACMMLAGDDAARRELECRGYEIFKRRNQSDYLRRAIDATTRS